MLLKTSLYRAVLKKQLVCESMGLGGGTIVPSSFRAITPYSTPISFTSSRPISVFTPLPSIAFTFAKTQGAFYWRNSLISYSYSTVGKMQESEGTKDICESETFSQLSKRKYYIDKTDAIMLVVHYNALSISLPHCFGKSSTLKMHQFFYGIDMDENGQRHYPSSKGLTEDRKKLEKLAKEKKKSKENSRKKKQAEKMKKQEKQSKKKENVVPENDKIENLLKKINTIDAKIKQIKKSSQSKEENIQIQILQGNKITIQSDLKKIQQLSEIENKRLQQLSSIQSEEIQQLKELEERIQRKEEGLKKKIQSKSVFMGKKISGYKKFEELVENEMGQHPIIKISIQIPEYQRLNIKGPWKQQKEEEEIVKAIKISISRTFRQHQYLLAQLPVKISKETALYKDGDLKADLSDFQRICDYQQNVNLKKEGSEKKDTLFEDKEIDGIFIPLFRLLSFYWGELPIILIDDYDAALISCIGKHYQWRVFNMLKWFYRKLIQSQKCYWHKLIVMGTAPIAYDECPSNLQSFTIDRKYQESYFGFTEEEVRTKLKEYVSNYQEEKNKQTFETQLQYLKAWCNGYVISKKEIYNPWLVNQCLDEIAKNINQQNYEPLQTFNCVWPEKGPIETIRGIIMSSKDLYMKRFQEVMFQRLCYQYENILMSRPMPIDEKKHMDNMLFFFLYHSGYLKPQRTYVYEITNKAVQQKLVPNQILKIYLDKRFPVLNKPQEQMLGKQLMKNMLDPQKFMKNVEDLFKCIQLSKIKKLQGTGKQFSSIQKDFFFQLSERDVTIIIKTFYDQLKMEEKLPFEIKEQATADGKKIGRLVIPDHGDTVVIHEDKIAICKDERQAKPWQGLSEIIDKYLRSVLKRFQKDSVIKNIQIQTNVLYWSGPGYLAFQCLDKLGKIDQKYLTYCLLEATKVYADVLAYIFTLEQAEALLKEHDEWYRKTDHTEEDNYSKRQKFQKMLKKHGKQQIKMIY